MVPSRMDTAYTTVGRGASAGSRAPRHEGQVSFATTIWSQPRVKSTRKTAWTGLTPSAVTRTLTRYTPGGKISTPDGLGGAKKRSWLGAEASAKQRSSRRG